MTETHHSAEAEALAERARNVLPAGTFGNVTFEVAIREARGGHAWDVSGNQYIDYLLGSGPMLVGHAHPDVQAAIEAQLPNGTTYFVNNEHGVRLAEEIVDAVACADKVRFVSTGSEATLYAMRVARAHMGRDKILKFEGGYHGMSDYALMSMAPSKPGNFPQAAPDSAGIPRQVRDEILIAPYNDAETACALIREHADELAGVIVEPLQRMIPPEPGFLEALRQVTEECGILLIFDEVVTGFRFAYGGGQAFYGVTPDVCALGKVVGGGFPLAAIAGRDDIMANFDAKAVAGDHFVKQIGTLSGNPVAAAAGVATLEILKREGAYEQIFATGEKLMAGLRAAIDKYGVEAQVLGVPPMFDILFTKAPVTDYRGALKSDRDMLARFNAAMLENGILKGDNKFYVSLAHTDEDVEKTLEAFDVAMADLAGA